MRRQGTSNRLGSYAIGMVVLLLGSIPAAAADLQLNKTLFLTSEATPAPKSRLLQPATTDATVAELGTATYDESQSWQFQASGQSGRVLIVHEKSKARLEMLEAPADDQPAPVKLTVPVAGAAAPTSQQWRIITADNGAFHIQNVQSGRFLEADPATIASASGQTILHGNGREGKANPNRRWRIVQGGISFIVGNGQLNGTSTTPVANNAPAIGSFKLALLNITPAVTVPAAKTGAEDFNGDVVVTVTAELLGDGTSELSLKLTMKATDNTITLESTQTISLVKATGGKRLYLAPGYKLKETLGYTDKNDTRDFVQANGMNDGDLVTEVSLGATLVGLDPTQQTLSIMAGMACVGKGPGPDEGKTGALISLVPIPFMVETP